VRVIVVVRPDADTRPGGDVVQARAIARFLRSRGAEVSEQVTGRMDLRRTDVAVLLNLTLTDQAAAQSRVARRRGVPYVLFPVFWDLTGLPDAPTAQRVLPVGSRRRELGQRVRGAVSRGRAGVPELLDASLLRRDRDVRRRVAEAAAFVHPNSAAELEHLRGYLRTDGATWTPIRNGVWRSELDAVAGLSLPRTSDIVSVGAISPRKSTLTLVRAARRLSQRVLVVGQRPHPRDAYARRVLAEAPANVEFAGGLPHRDVLRLIATARAHVLASHVETPGLATMEALGLGTPAVASDTAVVREYFGELPRYAVPGQVDSLVQAVEAASADVPDEAGATSLRQRYDWSTVLEPLAAELSL
jgi:glycosyltransferase involved in cell wall biosynthesis